MDTSDVYWRARSEFARLLALQTGSTEDYVVEAFEQIDTKNIGLHGVSPDRYFLTMQDTSRLIREECSLPPSEDTEWIAPIAGSIRSKHPSPIPGAKALLEWAKSRFTLALLTRGESALQLHKLKAVGFAKFFSEVEVVSSKEAGSFSSLISKLKFAPAQSWIFGDSIRADINPGIEIGARCIHYVYKHPKYHWRQEHVAEPIGAFFQIHSLDDAKLILSGTGASSFLRVRS